MRLEQILAQLRHAYMHLASGRVVDQKQFAEGLLAPQIRALEIAARDNAGALKNDARS